MSYGKLTISTYSNEIDFVKEFLSQLSSISNRIVCPSNGDIETIYSNAGYYDTPTFNITIDGVWTITFTRSSRKGSYTDGYTLTTNMGVFQDSNGTNKSTGWDWVSGTSLFGYDAIATRIWKLKYAVNSECIYLSFIDCDQDFDSSYFQAFGIENTETTSSAVSFTFSENILSNSFIGTNTECVIKNRLPYKYDESNDYTIEKINKKIFVTKNTSNKTYEATTLHDVSTVEPYADIIINNVHYYSLDEHTIMEI